jgi:hypothetical protein
VTVRLKALAPGTLARAVAFTVPGPPTDGQQQIGYVHQSASFRGRQCTLHVQAGADGGEPELGHGVDQRESSQGMHPFGKGFQVREDPDDRPVTPGTPLGREGGLEVVLKGDREPRSPGRALVSALLGQQKPQEEC